MKYRPLGKTGMNASVVALGTWVTGGGSVWGQNPDDRESIRAIHAALDVGVNLIDTAPAYGWGRSEQVVGEALRDRRDKALIATKCGLWWDDPRGSYFAHFDGKDVRRSLRPDTMRLEVERSLRRMKTDYIDLYQTHWPSVAPDLTPIADTMACLLAMQTEGKIRAVGVSNVSLAELEENCACGPVASDQLRYSILYRQPEADLLPYCQKHELSTLTYMSLEQGLLTGKVGLDREFAKDEFRANDAWNPWFTLANRPKVLDLLARWQPLLRKYECTLAQLVVAWTAAQPGITHVLCGARRQDQILDTARAGDLQLQPADLAQMRQDAVALGDPQPGGL